MTAKNILLNEDESIVKISDLRQAKFRPSNIQYLSTKAPGCVVYMSPECLGDRPHFTAKSDTFSFGVVMLHIFTQEPPSCGLENIGAKPEIERRADDLSKLSDDHPLKSSVVACLDDDRNKRPDMREVQSTLGSVLAVENLQKTGNFECIEGYQKLKSELSRDEKVSLISFLSLFMCRSVLTQSSCGLVNLLRTTTGLTGLCEMLLLIWYLFCTMSPLVYCHHGNRHNGVYSPPSRLKVCVDLQMKKYCV